MKRLLILIVASLVIFACDSNDEPAPPVDNSVDFTEFVIDEINLTNENDDPAIVNGVEFNFNEDETAFDTIL